MVKITTSLLLLASSMIANHQVSPFTTTTTTTTTTKRAHLHVLSQPCPTFFSSSSSYHSPSHHSSKSQTQLQMALTPVGPFCPFRSEAAIDMEPRVEAMNSVTPNFAAEMARLQLDMQLGQAPDSERLKTVAKGINAAVDDWESLLTRLKISNDFQTREYAKLTQAHLASHGQSAEEIATMMRWQSDCMIAMAENRPPPFPPAGIDVMKMMEDAQKNASAGKDVPSMTQMAAAEKITTTPFTGDEPAFKEDTVREEYEALCRDHNDLIGFGKSYATFDPMGKIAYLDQIESIEERWDIFFARFSLLGQLNQEFVKQCNDFLDSMGLDENGFRQLLKDTHDIMRKDAERERGLVA